MNAEVGHPGSGGTIGADEKTAQLQEAIRATKILFDRTARVNNAVAPYVKRLEYIERELQRTHSTIQIRIQNRENAYEDEKFLTKLREQYITALDEYATIVREAADEYKQSNQ